MMSKMQGISHKQRILIRNLRNFSAFRTDDSLNSQTKFVLFSDDQAVFIKKLLFVEIY